MGDQEMAAAGAACAQNLSPATTPPPLLQTGSVGGRAGLPLHHLDN
ncbi:MAG: hypothetical protein RLZZ631_1601 [Cyanobacteriota bacterium]|jgi:hypothetical protein